MTGQPCLGVYEKALPSLPTWADRLSAAAEIGYSFVEMSVDESAPRLSRLDWNPGARSAVRAAIAATGVRIPSICLSAHRRYPLGSADAQTRAHAVDLLTRCIRLAVDLGVRIVQVAGYHVFYEPDHRDARQWYVDGLAAGVAEAARHGVMLGIENVEGIAVTSISAALAVADEIGSPWLQVYPDIGNLAEQQLDVVGELALGAGRMVAVHVKDTRPGQPRRVPFGSGVTPFDAAFAQLAGQGFTGAMMVEMWNDQEPDALAAALAARKFVEERLTRLRWR